MRKAALLLACVCALAGATTAAFAQAASQADTQETAVATSQPKAKAAGERLRKGYRHWRHKLDRHNVWRGRNLVRAARSDDRAPTARELRRSIRRMKVPPRVRAVVVRSSSRPCCSIARSAASSSL